MFLFFFTGQLNDTQQELKENNELVVELQGIRLVIRSLTYVCRSIYQSLFFMFSEEKL